MQAGLPVGHAWPLPEIHWAKCCGRLSACQECVGQGLFGAACVAVQEAESEEI